jgi:CrcB protein
VGLVLLVALGGAVGSVGRYLLVQRVQALVEPSGFPFGTLAVNAVGCAAVGVLGGLAESRGLLTPQARAFLAAGVLGGFTTFSAFGFETVALAERGSLGGALANVGLQLGFGLGAVWAGYQVARSLG